MGAGQFSVVPASSQISVNGQTYRLHNLTASGEYNNVALSYSISNLFATQSTAITGTGRLTFNSAGTLILTASNTYTGSTTISAGTLQVGMSGTTGVLGPGTVTNNATLAFSRSDAVTFADAIIGSGSLVQRGSGVLTLTATNTYAGTTTISSGTLQVGDGGTVGTLGSGTVVNNAALVFNRSDVLTAANAISGSGSLTKLLSGTVTLSGSNSYTGGTTVAAGRLVGTTSSLQGTITNNAAVTFDQSTSGTYAGSMVGSGSLVKSGVGTVTFSGSNTLDGGLSLSAGTLAVGSANALGSSGTVSFGGGTLQYTANNATDYSSRFSNDAGQAYSIDTNGRNVTLAAALTSSGGVFTKLGSGTLTLGGANTYDAGTTVSGGRLVGTTSSLQGAIANAATVEFSQGVDGNYSGVMSGTGSLTKSGGGTVTLSGSSSYSGGTTVSAGRLVGTTSSLQGTIANAAAVEFAQSGDGTYAGVVSGTGLLTKSGAGTVTLSGSNSYSGGTTVSAGRLVGTTSSLQGTITNNAAVTFDQSTSGTYAGSMAGSGSLVKSGVGTVTFSGSNALAGGLSLSAGTLAVGSVNALGSSGTISFGGGTLQYTASNATDYSSRFSNDAGQAYSVDTNGRNVTLAAALTSSGGVLTKSGAGTLTLTAANTYSGVTTIADGTLSVGDGGTVGDLGGSGTITNIGALAINRSNAVSLGRGITGAGAFWQLGTGTTTLTGINSYSGGTVVSAGQLVGTTDSLQGGITNNAAVEFAQAASGNYAGNMGGSGSLTKSGAGAVTLTGSNAYSGGTTISAGALAVAAIADAGASNIGTSGPLTLSGGTLDYTGSAAATTARVVDISAANTTSTIGVAAAAGRLTLTGKVWNSGTAHPNVVLNKTGAGTLEIAGAGSNVGTSLVVQSGTVVLNATQRAVYEVRGLDAGATLQLGRSDQIFSGDAISTTGNIRMTGGTLDLNGFNETVNRVSGADFTTTGTGVITSAAPATLTFGNNLAGRPSRFAGTITGSVAINVKGTNPVTLSGENTYSGSTTIQDAGTQLRIGVGGTTGSLGTGAVTNGGELVFDRSDSVTVANAISGSGSVVQAGAGTTTLIGANSYAGTTTIAAGRLVGTTSSLPGAIANASQLEFAQAAAGTFAAAISGTGSFTKTGGGNLILSGSSSYSGATSVAAGRLSVNGILGDTPVAVLAAAELGGSGSIAGPVSIAAGGSLAPGNSIASLASGTASFAAAATFAYEVDSTNPLSLGSAADLLVVSGDLNLDSGNASLLTLADLASSVQPFVEDTTIFAMINYSGAWNGGLFTYGGNVLSDGERFYAGSQMWEIDYNRTSATGLDNFTADYLPSSSFVTVTAVPEPSTLVLMAIGAGVAAVAARQRHASGRHCRTGG